jgi:hypothetical protein
MEVKTSSLTWNTQGEKVLCCETRHGGKFCGGRDPFDDGETQMGKWTGRNSTH